MPIVIASLVTRLNLVESKKLICENCHSGAAGIRGGRNNSVTNYILQRLIKSWLLPFPICFFQSATVSCVSKSTNLSRRDHRCILPFSGFLYLTSSSIIAIDYLVINDRGWGAKSSKKLGQTTNFEKSIAFACSTIKFGLVCFLKKVLQDLKSFCSS